MTAGNGAPKLGAVATAVASDDDLEFRRLRLRYPGRCTQCGVALSKGADAWYAADKRIFCPACGPVEGIEETAAGASAAAEAARRRARRVEKVRREHGDLAAEVADALVQNEMEATFLKGSAGESRLAAWVSKEVGDVVIPLHDRLIPGTKGNIDHIFVAPTGVWVVDAKTYKGKVEERHRGPIWKRETRLFVDNRDRTKLVPGVERQIDTVRLALRADSDLAETPIHGVLCFTNSKWALLDFPFSVGRVWVAYPGALKKQLKKSGQISHESMQRIARRLALTLPPAA